MDLCLDYITYDPKDWTVLQKFFCTLPLAIRLKVTSSWEALRKTLESLPRNSENLSKMSFQTSWIMKVLKFLQNWINLLKKIFLTLLVRSIKMNLWMVVLSEFEQLEGVASTSSTGSLLFAAGSIPPPTRPDARAGRWSATPATSCSALCWLPPPSAPPELVPACHHLRCHWLLLQDQQLLMNRHCSWLWKCRDPWTAHLPHLTLF